MTESPNTLFVRLFVESRQALQRYVRRLVRSRDTADEIVQEAFLSAKVRTFVDWVSDLIRQDPIFQRP
jgi:DNA-directed RNA polymerase specialized sigma24 family protein